MASSDAVFPWLIVAAAVLAVAATTAVWAVGQVAEWSDTDRWPATGWSLTLLPVVAGSGPWPWPNTDPPPCSSAPLPSSVWCLRWSG